MSERTKGDYALAFRTRTDIRHWRIVRKYYVHPRPNPYNSQLDIIEVSKDWNSACLFVCLFINFGLCDYIVVRMYVQ